MINTIQIAELYAKLNNIEAMTCKQNLLITQQNEILTKLYNAISQEEKE